MRRYPERGDDPRIGRNKNVLSPEFGGRLVCVAGQPKDLDGVRVRIDDPVFGDAGAFVEREFFPAVPFFRPFGKNLQQKVRRAVDVLFSDEGQAIFRDEHQVRFHRPERIVGENDIGGCKKDLTQRIVGEKDYGWQQKDFRKFSDAGCLVRGSWSTLHR